MTIAQLLESITGKKICATHKGGWSGDGTMKIDGFEANYEDIEEASDGTPFVELNIDQRKAELKRLGYESNGNEVLIDGITGEMIEDAFIFMGPTYYQKLKHLVSNKVHARATGPNESLVRQPTGGRKHVGGLRVGEMEKDCFIMHGASEVTRDRMFMQSDRFATHVCRTCGNWAINNPHGQRECRVCNLSGDDVAQIQIPYTTKLAFQYLTAIGIVPRVLMDPKHNFST